jgi:hypothetical protein
MPISESWEKRELASPQKRGLVKLQNEKRLAELNVKRY